jgi:queuine/archaeosine tRNA-ribosyltransferase
MNVHRILVITICAALNEDDTPLVRPMCESFGNASKIRYDKAFPIVQGSCYKDLRQQSAEYIANSKQVAPLEDFQLGNRRNVCYDRSSL